MTKKRICYTDSDGTVSVIVPAPAFMAKFGSEADGLAAVRAKSLPAEATNVVELDDSDIPFRGGLRNAWRQSGAAAPTVDMTVARAIKTDSIRPERNARLAALDIEYHRADEASDNDEKGKIKTTKQELRDLPASIQSTLNGISSPEDLDAYEPTWPTKS